MKTILLVIVGGTLWGLLLLAEVGGATHVSGIFDHFFFHTVFGGIVFLGILVLFAIQSVRFLLPTRKAGRPQRQQFDPSRN
jgi:membrane protein implicated in regulation of membrane protease activity